MIDRVRPLTRELWSKQDQHCGDRFRLFGAIRATVDAAAVLYPGSYVDISPSFWFPAVTYVDEDDRAAEFFADVPGVRELIAEHRRDGATTEVRFIHGDYRTPTCLEPQSVDLLVSLYAGLVSEFCTDYLRIGGVLMVNPSHGDAAMASIDARYQLCAVVESRSGDYRVTTASLDGYLIPKTQQEVTVDLLHQTGRGIGYTKSPFAYLFTRVL